MSPWVPSKEPGIKRGGERGGLWFAAGVGERRQRGPPRLGGFQGGMLARDLPLPGFSKVQAFFFFFLKQASYPEKIGSIFSRRLLLAKSLTLQDREAEMARLPVCSLSLPPFQPLPHPSLWPGTQLGSPGARTPLFRLNVPFLPNFSLQGIRFSETGNALGAKSVEQVDSLAKGVGSGTRPLMGAGSSFVPQEPQCRTDFHLLPTSTSKTSPRVLFPPQPSPVPPGRLRPPARTTTMAP